VAENTEAAFQNAPAKAACGLDINGSKSPFRSLGLVRAKNKIVDRW